MFARWYTRACNADRARPTPPRLADALSAAVTGALEFRFGAVPSTLVFMHYPRKRRMQFICMLTKAELRLGLFFAKPGWRWHTPETGCGTCRASHSTILHILTHVIKTSLTLMHAPVLLVQDDPFTVLKIHQLWLGEASLVRDVGASRIVGRLDGLQEVSSGREVRPYQ